jgi:hypothetical protein
MKQKSCVQKPFDFERIESITENWGLSAVKEVAQRCQSVGMYMKIEVKKGNEKPEPNEGMKHDPIRSNSSLGADIAQ